MGRTVSEMTPAKGYTEMKDSGIEWISEIPAHWGILRGKNLLRLLERPVKPDDDVITCFRDGEVTLRKNRREEGFTNSLKEIGYQGIEPGDLIVHGMDGFAGSIGISDSRGKASPVLNVMDSNQNKRYLMYYLRAMAYKDVFMALSTGIRVRSCDLRWNKLSVFPFLIPTSHEQSAIATYLDTQCAKIDEIIAQAQASIEDYKQWKASIIYEAVTKGLDPNVEMKDSGIEWIGKIPVHWAISRIKNIATNLDYLREPISAENRENKLGLYDYYGASGVIDKIDDYNVDDTALLIGEDGANLRMRNLPLVYRASGKFWVNNHAHILKVKPGCSYGYVAYLLEAGDYNVYITGSAQPKLSQFNLMRFPIVIPDLKEQVQIEKYLDKWCLQIDTLIAEKEDFLIDLASYKKSLIYEVVTGKRRVPNTSETTIAILTPEILRYRKALLMLRVLDLLGDDTRGRIQLQKCMFAAECLLNMPFHTQFIRYKQGPYDLELLNIEEILNKEGWYTVLNGSPVTYQKGEQFEEGLKKYMSAFSDVDLKLEKIVGFLKPMKTTQAGRVATLLAAWNDFIIDGRSHPTDREIINEVMSNWTPNKANTQYSTWQDTLTKMRKNRFIPSGFGIHTLKKEVLLQGE